MVLQKLKTNIEVEMTSNMIYIVAHGVGLNCPRKIHSNTQWGGGSSNVVDIIPQLPVFIVLTDLPKYGGGTQSPPLALPVPTALFLVHSRFMH